MTQNMLNLADPSRVAFTFPCIKAVQPIGDLYVASLPYKILCTISDFDVRRVLQEDRDVEKYLGIQRPLHPKRVKEIAEYVNFSDAAFPGSIILAVEERAAQFDAKSSQMTLRNIIEGPDPILARRIARVIDGQHRIAGLYKFRGDNFDCPVTILTGMDIADQAQIFARVNLTQTKVNPSLAYDLYELAETRSPQKTAHDVTVRLDRAKDGPFFRRIKRLGLATPGRETELLTQATIVKGLLQHMSPYPDRDRDALLRGQNLSEPTDSEAAKFIFRRWFVRGEDDAIYHAVSEFFEAVRERWPQAWNHPQRGVILPRTNGYFALMRYLRDATLYVARSGSLVSKAEHLQLLENVDLEDKDLTVENYDPGGGGEAKLYRNIRDQALPERVLMR
ncbi:MAG: hypothetical protein QOI38_2286 [Sphingomonadales bacterium]|jgi:DGQHR domain-containing protein|nr:hypothetical protein [Sphingomonadales bacterium]